MMTMGVVPRLPRCALLISLAFAINLKVLNAFQLPTSPEWSTKTTNSLNFPSSNRALPDARAASNSAHATVLFYRNPFDSSIDEDPAAERERGLLVLFSVPLAWGTFEPAVRFVYQLQPDIPPFVFSLVYYLVATSALLFFASRPAALDDDVPIGGDSIPLEESDESLSKPTVADLLPIQGGLELGTYLFIGNGLQVVGLKTVPSDRAAFLLQLTTIFVPLVQAIFARNLLAVPTKTWIACLIALCGVGLMGLDGAGDGSISSLSSVSLDNIEFSQGDMFIILGALAYTFHCIRLEGYAKTTSAAKLAAAKASTETMWSALTVTTCVIAALTSSTDGSTLDVARRSGENIISYVGNFQNELQDTSAHVDQWSTLAAAVAWTGLVTVAYTIYAQSFGQSRVKPATANLIYSIQPLFTALFAWAILGETLGPAGYAGGALIGSSVLLVIQDDDGSNDDNAITDETIMSPEQETVAQ